MPCIRVLRRRDCYRAVRDAITAGCDRFGMRVVEYSVQGNHLHLLCEAGDRRALSRGLQGLLLRVARAVNRTLGRTGRVCGDRYRSRPLRIPAEVRHALVYVLQNAKGRFGVWPQVEAYGTRAIWLDPCSSARAFFGLEERWLPAARSWMLTGGWGRAGPIDPDDLPARAVRRLAMTAACG